MNVLEIIAGPLFKVIDKLIPDPQAKAQAQLELLKLQQEGEFKELEANLAIAQGQLAVNLEEAKSESLFKSGWRPAVGWVCVIGLVYTYLAQPLLAWYSVAHAFAAPPVLDLGALLTLLAGMLGLGTLRTTEKIRECRNDSIKRGGNAMIPLILRRRLGSGSGGGSSPAASNFV